MNKRKSPPLFISLILCPFFAFQVCYGQCPVAPVLLSNQNAVDNFPTDYPGCTNPAVLITVTGANITNLDGLNGIISTDNSLIIRDNPSLLSLSGLSNLTSIAVELKIEDNALITSLAGLESLNWLGGHLSIQGNTQLTTLNGIGPIPSLGSYLNVSFNPALTDLSALSSIQEVGPDYFNGFLAIRNNNSLPALNGLNLISETGSYCSIGSNPAMTAINGLNGLSIVNGDFEITGNPMLGDLNAFASLTTIDGSFNIDNNPSLTDIDEFASLATVNGTLTIASNPSLSDCDAQGICDFVNGQGLAIISSNTTGCNSISEVEAACLLLPVELTVFEGKSEQNNVMLRWQTASEKNNDYFSVQHRGPSDAAFREIGQMAGAGNATSVNHYEFIHTNPPAGIHYYRLKQVDTDGRYEYSPIISVFVNGNFEEPIDIFPNPTFGSFIVKGDYRDRTARVTDLAGREVLVKSMTQSCDIDITDQPDGVYLVHIQTAGQHIVKKVVKRRKP
ncbi:MAG: T9SS type A sorting domain-containing protein [Saprospiraceae bacterium]|nr:T9SS type A sorting domain-containing protein [Saprospiraceae bacterium]MCB0542651.1 T9SS type A sorting domain-containing protein [Saprospiraceae bacterium]MCB0576822.1 T9SS type A sorting domain-containing protein [Saprospiraceae bacterium]MCB9354304.1 T9SS type A sorting domain-containing protein [Lewinellaceae bacterium]